MENKKKRFYKKGEKVWIIAQKKHGIIDSIDRETVSVTVRVHDTLQKLKMWEIDKFKDFQEVERLKKEAEENVSKELNLEQTYPAEFIHPPLPEPIGMEFIKLLNALMYPTVYFAKVRPGAIIPSKREEDAGYDIYANLEEVDGDLYCSIECPVHATTLVPTGLAVALPKTHYLNLKHERGSTGVQSMSVLAGVVDSGFRNEMFIAITPLRKSVIITNAVDKVKETETHILYPYSKAIAQGTIDIVPNASIVELPYTKLKEIDSERGMTMLGESGK